MTSDTKTNQARVALWNRYVVQRATRTVNKPYEMPNTNCNCHATSKRHKQLSWHALPIDPKLNKRLTVAIISNDILKVNSRGTSECGLHFQGERRTHNVNTATIFPYSFSRNFTCRIYIRMNVVYLRLLGIDCWNWQVTASKAVRKLLGRGGYKRWTNEGQTMDNSWINALSREFTVSSIGCAYRAELILGR